MVLIQARQETQAQKLLSVWPGANLNGLNFLVTPAWDPYADAARHRLRRRIGKRYGNNAKRPITLALQRSVIGEDGINLAIDARLDFIGRKRLPDGRRWTKVATICSGIPGE